MNLGNCDVCGRELQGYTSVNGMKFCAKCYQETFGQPTNNCLCCAFKSANEKMKTNSIKGFEKLKKENEQLKEQLQEQIDYKDEYYHYWQETKKEQRKNKQIRKQICDEIRRAFNKEDFWLYGDNNKIISIHEDKFNEILDKIEKGNEFNV